MAKYYSFIFIAISLTLITTAAYAQSPECKTCQAAEQSFTSCYGSAQVQFTDPKAMQCLCQSQVLNAYDMCSACEKELRVTDGLSQYPKSFLLSKCGATAVATTNTIASTSTSTSTSSANTSSADSTSAASNANSLLTTFTVTRATVIINMSCKELQNTANDFPNFTYGDHCTNTNKAIKDIAMEVHATLFSRDNAEKENVIRSYFDVQAVFEDPAVHVQGRRNIALQFTLLSCLFSSIRADYRAVAEASAPAGHYRIIIDSDVTYGLLCWQNIEIRTISKFEFNEQNKIVRHEDVWSIADLIQQIPILGWLYAEIGRKTTGIVSNQLWSLVQEIGKAWNEWEV